MMKSLLNRMSPWTGAFPSAHGKLEATLILPFPSGTQGLLDPPRAKEYLRVMRLFLQEAFPGSFEIILSPFNSSTDSSRWRALDGRTFHARPFRWIPQTVDGVGQAVRRAVFQSHGRTILVGNLENYFSPDFYRRALATGADAVRASRREPDSEFVVPTRLLSMIYRRHTYGVGMNLLLKKYLGLGTNDGLSGAYVIRRETALRFFNRLTCPGYLYETELDIIAQANACPWKDISATFLLEHEKCLARVAQETLEAFCWLPRFRQSVGEGKYEFLRRKGNHLTADDWGLSHGVNDGILDLARLGHLRRVSVLADAPHLSYRLNELRRIPGIEWGLHFNLTAPYRPDSRSLLRWVWEWFNQGSLNRPDRARYLRKELERQIGVLKRRGIRIHRFDGHHHIHAIPGLLEAVSDILMREKIRYVRIPGNTKYKGAKSILNAWSRKMAPVMRLGFKALPFTYPEQDDFNSVNKLVKLLNRSKGCEVLIHPAAYDDIALDAPFDSLRKQRVVEYLSLRLLALELRLPIPRAQRRRAFDPRRIPPSSGYNQVPGPFPLATAAYSMLG